MLCAPDEAATAALAALAALLRSGHLCAVCRNAANATATEAPAAAPAATDSTAGQSFGSSKEATAAQDSPQQHQHSLQLEAAAAGAAAGPAAAAGDSTAGRDPPLGSVTLCLTAAAFAEPVAADEGAQRAWNRHLAALLPWLLPGDA